MSVFENNCQTSLQAFLLVYLGQRSFCCANVDNQRSKGSLSEKVLLPSDRLAGIIRDRLGCGDPQPMGLGMFSSSSRTGKSPYLYKYTRFTHRQLLNFAESSPRAARGSANGRHPNAHAEAQVPAAAPDLNCIAHYMA